MLYESSVAFVAQDTGVGAGVAGGGVSRTMVAGGGFGPMAQQRTCTSRTWLLKRHSVSLTERRMAMPPARVV